jgi:hypothetical protein
MLDLASPEVGVQIQIDNNGAIVWVNVDGVCRLRIQGIQPGCLELDDYRSPEMKKR